MNYDMRARSGPKIRCSYDRGDSGPSAFRINRQAGFEILYGCQRRLAGVNL